MLFAGRRRAWFGAVDVLESSQMRFAMEGASLSDRRRKYTENSVVASIGQIQAMLAADEQPTRPTQAPPSRRSLAPADAPAPPNDAELARPVPRPVHAQGALVVPSWEEVQDNRAARWADESQTAVIVRSASRWRQWRGPLLWGAITLGLVGAAIATMWWLRPAQTESRPFAMAYVEAMHSAELAGLAYIAQQELGALQAEHDTLSLARDTLKVRAESAEARAKAAEVVASTVANANPEDGAKTKQVKRRRVRKRRGSKRRTTRRKKRSPRATKTDKNLEGLLNSL